MATEGFVLHLCKVVASQIMQRSQQDYTVRRMHRLY